MEGFITCGIAVNGRVIVVGCGELKSWNIMSMKTLEQYHKESYLLEQILSQHQNLRIRSEALHGRQVPDLFLRVFRGRHDLQNIKRSP